MFEAFGPSSAELPECVEVTVVILSFYVIALRLTARVSGVTISLYAIFVHSMKIMEDGQLEGTDDNGVTVD
jgi:hypothetical protein